MGYFSKKWKTGTLQAYDSSPIVQVQRFVTHSKFKKKVVFKIEDVEIIVKTIVVFHVLKKTMKNRFNNEIR